MKKSTRKFISLMLALCLVMTFALSVSAANNTYNGTYKNQGFTATSTYNSYTLKGVLGSTSSYAAKVTIEYDFKDSPTGGASTGNTISSLPAVGSASISVGMVHPQHFSWARFTYRLEGTQVHRYTASNIS